VGGASSRCGSRRFVEAEINLSRLRGSAYACWQGDTRVILFLNWLGYLEVVMCVVALCFIVGRRQWREYWALGSFLAVRAISNGCSALIIHYLHKVDQVHRHAYYQVYFYLYWSAFAIESVLALIILYSVFRNTMGPLKGLRIVGTVVLGAAAAFSLRVVFSPHATGTRYMIASISQLQLTQSILTVCLLLFVSLAVRPVGLSYRSKVFGVTLGLGILAISNLAQSAWSARVGMHVLADLANGMVICATLAIWAVYFAMREPERRGVAPDSFLFRWNARTLALLG
jgi:hypothetical protein